MTAQSFLVELETGALECRRIVGAADRPTLVLLHEGLGCVALWRDFPDALAHATGCAVFLYSRYGYGRSAPAPLPWPLDYMQREGHTGLTRILAAAGIGRHVLVGHSDGASIALVHAGSAARPNLVGLIAIAPHVFTEVAGLTSIAAAREAFCAGDLRARLTKYHGANVDCAFRGWSESWLHPDFRAWNVEAYLSAIMQPVLLLQGAEDQYGSEEQLRRIERQVTPAVETHVLAACQHAPHLEQPALTLSVIKSFLEKQRG